MKVYKDAVDFDLIEADKENIQPLREGRSAVGLTSILSASPAELKLKRIKERKQLEESLKDLEELDDPLEPFLQYIKWTNENYPSGATVESGLMELLERCTFQFQDTPYYKNDPRYLRIWLLYAKCSPIPRDTFIYLFRKEIGTKLALYYEDFANYLESQERYHQADDVFQEGIKQMARPIARLQKRYSEFLERYKLKREQQAIILANEPKSPIFPARAALQLKSGIISSASLGGGGGGADTTTSDSSKLVLRRKLEVFNDEANDSSSSSNKNNINGAVFGKEHTNSWERLGSNNYRNKENRMESKPWAGEILRQDPSKVQKLEKLSVFHDEEEMKKGDGPVYKIVNDPNKPKPEKITVNEDLLYNNRFEDEMDLEMMLFMMKKLRLKERQHTPKEMNSISIEQFTTPQKREPLKESDAMVEVATPETAKNSPISHTTIRTPSQSPGATLDAVHRTEIHPLKPPSTPLPNNNKRIRLDETVHLGSLNHNTNTFKGDSPTKTFFTKSAEKDIFSFFNQHIGTEPQNSIDNGRGGGEGDDEEDEDQQFMYDYTDHTQQLTNAYVPNLDDFTEGLTTGANATKKIPDTVEAPLVNPADESLKRQLLELINPPLSQYPGFHEFQEGKMNMCSTLKKSINVKQTRSVFVNFKSDQSTYSLISLLGEGGYASVYLSESMNGNLCAIKAQKPASAWEFYILKQVEQRLRKKGQMDILKSIITAKELHLYEDESYLILEYLKKGTLLDIVNLYRSRGQQVDEILVIFIAIQLLKIIESLHGIGIIHGDLKPDNCMLRLQDLDNNSDLRIQSRGVKLIDFGRSIDMESLPDGVQFTANWAMDEQDCPEMREHKPWSYQADYYGVASIIHTMLFGSFIETQRDSNTGLYFIKNHFKRYMKSELWSPLFETLINSSSMNTESPGKLPITAHVVSHRKKLESFMEDERSKNQLLSVFRGIETDLK